MKLDYSTSHNKRIVQHAIFPQYRDKVSKVIGLAGPNITDYLKYLSQVGIKEAEIYEKNPIQLISQLQDFKPVIPATIHYQDIIKADPDQEDTLYDLDFCNSIQSLEDHVVKFKKNFVLTLAIRPIGLERTLKTFCRLKNHKKHKLELVKHLPAYKQYRLTTGIKNYNCFVYFDTISMLTIQSL